MDLNDLFNAAGGASSQDDEGGQDMLSGLLGGLAGGSGSAQGGGDMLGGLLGGLMGGQGGQSQGGQDMLSGLLGGLMGGQGGGDALGLLGGQGGMMGMVAPLIENLVEKVGLPRQAAQAVVMFLAGKLMSGPSPQGGPGRAAQGGLDVNKLAAQWNSNQGFDTDYVKSTGLVFELSQETGLDEATATRSLQEVFNFVGGQMGGQ